MRQIKLRELSLTLLLPLLACAAGARAAELPAQLGSAAGARFLLLERDTGRPLLDADVSTAAETPGLDALSSELPFSYSEDAWNAAREAVESGNIPGEIAAPAPVVEVSSGAPLVPEPQVEFKESGTTLSVTGRKVIALSYSGKKFLNRQTTVTRAQSLSLFEITQQMQVRMQGKVGEKITVNVDYDDTKQDKQDISVVYQGEANEVVQNVSFGDIDLSLPATEFVSYNKQLFGIRADLKTNRLKFTFVGSRTKGITKTKQYTGNTQFQTADLADTSYLRHKYYDVSFGNTARLPIKSASERIYIDQQTQAPVDGVIVLALTGKDMAVQTSSYTGRFQLLNPGTDYIMDYAKGLLTFNRTLNTQDVVIIDYQNAGGTYLSQNGSTTSVTADAAVVAPAIIKTQNDIALSSDTAVSSLQVSHLQEQKTYYSIGQSNLVRDDGRGNFTLKIQDLNRNEVLPTVTNNMPKYPDNIEVDFEQGIFHLKQPFTLDGAPAASPDPQVYSASPVSKRVIRVEYSYRFKTFLLEPDIVLQSEVIRVNGAKFGRNEDYFIDYESGFITFYYPERIGQDAKIDITYEVSPFGGVGNQSLVGGRASYDLGSHFSLGSTLLYQGGIKSNSVPSVTDLTNSMMVYEGDAQLKGLNLLGLRTTLSGEVAQSRMNPNMNDYALVDNMEGVKQDDSASLDRNYWFIAANPTLAPASPDALDWQSEIVKLRDINPASTSDGTQQVLSVHYDFSVSSEVSIVYPLSPTGVDFSQKNMMELVVFGANGTAAGTEGPQFNIHMGQINEDADNTGGQNFVCTSGLTLANAPKSEDTNCDEQVSNAEDIGWLYAPPGLPSRRYGGANGRLDSEDLNRNGRLDAQDFTGGSFGYVSNSKFTDNNDSLSPLKNTIDFSGWHTLVMPMKIASADAYKWNAIKQVRISLKKSAFSGAPVSGTIKFARISAVGNTWNVQDSTTPSDTGVLHVAAENNLDNVSYTPIYEAGGDASAVFKDLYGTVSEQKQKTNSKNLSEQTLALSYEGITSTSTAYVYRKFSRPVDISQHAEFRFLIKPENLYPNTSFYLQLGDANNYFRAEIPMSFSDWRLITINQEDLNGDNIPEIWTNGSNFDVTVSSRGNPSLQQVSQIIVGVTAADLSPHSGKVYLNEVHLAKPLTRVGNARKVEGSFEIPGWLSFGGKHRYVDRNFQTPVTVIANQDNEQQTGYMNITRLSFLPVSVTAARQITATPNAFVTGSNNLVNSMQQGRVKKFDGTATGSLAIKALPKFGFNYTKGVTDYTVLSRKDNKDIYAANFTYAVPGSFFLLPEKIDANYSLGRSKVTYDPARLLNLADLYDTDERTDIYGGKLAFVPWKGASFNPGYALQTAREQRVPLSAPNTFERYPKSMQQTVDLNSNFPLARWFNPSASYSITTMENNNLTITTVTVARSSAVFSPGMIKAVTRTAQGSVSLTLSMNDLLPTSKLLRSLTLSSNYQIQDGDSWSNIEKEYDTRSKIWLRDSLRPSSPLALRNSITLRDTVTSNQRWQPFEGYGLKGRLATLNTLSVTNNYSNAVQRSEVTGTITKNVNRTFPDMIVSMSQLEVLTRTGRWAQNATVNIKYSHNSNESRDISLDNSDTYGMDLRFKLINKVDTAASYNLRMSGKRDLRLDRITQDVRHNDFTLQGAMDYRKVRLTPKIDYVSDVTKGTLGVVTQNTRTITPSLLMKADFQLPKGLRVPFTKKTIMFTNRIIWTTTLSYALQSSPITIAENSRLFSLNSSADYEAAKNLRLTFNLGLQRLWHKYLKQDEYVAYQAGSTLTFQF
ncbi:MAG: hypothetical protein NTY45_08250 [Elusimicrobia bacterium]|nr:hypothetical protein [Elusimicrobiota bacterium]